MSLSYGTIYHFRFSSFMFPVRGAMRIREVSEVDLEAIIGIQSGTPQAAQWTQADYAKLASDLMGLILVAEVDAPAIATVLGFAAFYRVSEEAELRNMAVDPSHRRQGVGRELLAEGLRRLWKQGVRQVYLEVRASNLPARQLYHSAGFGLRSRRKDYYNDPREDALVLSREFSGLNGPGLCASLTKDNKSNTEVAQP
jgi:ribosomal-protein-alanine N-acetyltransferase